MMRKAILFLLFSIVSFAQVPQGMSHRGTAYNTSGVILQNTSISIRVRILDVSTSGTIVYEETHNKTTNGTGQYNFNIGQGIPAGSFNFSTINWGTNNKFLEIGIDPTNGTNYTVVGSSQLMSVPYALYSEKSNGLNMVTLNTVDQLRTTNTHDKETLVYVKGYWFAGDGGGGFFSYDSSLATNDNEGTIFKPNSVTGNGRWVRQYNGYINARFFGVAKDWENPVSGFSNSDQIQKMINYASQNNVYSKEIGGMTLFFPNGTYFIDKKIILKNRIKLIGEPGTMFVNHNGVYDYMFALDVGEVSIFRIENFIINLNYKEDIGGFHLKGILTSSQPTGGIADAVFRNIRVLNSKGIGINLEGGEAGNLTSPSSNYLLPNQFIIFDNVRILKAKAENPALKISGQSANYTFINCEFASEGVAGACIHITSLNAGTTYNKFGSNGMSFINSGMGMGSEYGAIIEYASNITFDSCFFEGIDTAFTIKNSKQIKFSNNYFANCAGSGTRSLSFTGHAGSIFHIDNSQVSIENNNISVGTNIAYPDLDNQYFVQSQGGTSNTINLKDNSFDLLELSKTTGILQVIALNNYKLNSGGKKLIYLNTPAIYSATTNTLKRIDSTIGAGETMFIRANVGKLNISAMTTIVPNTNENIYLNGRTSVLLNIGQAATFIKIDDAGGNYLPTYQLVSISN